MNFRSSERHCATNIFKLDPSAAEIAWPFKFRDDTNRALLDHLRNKFVRVKEFATHCREQSSSSGLPRVVRYVGYDRARVAG